MGCFDNLIRVRATCGEQTEPESGLWLNDLPHMNMEVFDAAISPEAQSAYDEIVRKQRLAEKLVIGELRTFLASKFFFGSLVENINVGFFKNNKPAQAAQAGQMVGINVRVEEQPYLAFTLTRVGLNMDTTGDVIMYVIDLISGQTLHTFTVSAVAGKPTYLNVLKEVKNYGQRMNLFIGYDASAVGCYATTIDSLGDCYGCMANSGWATRSMSTVRGVKVDVGDDKIYENLVAQPGTSGITITYSLSCDLELFACSIRHLLAMPIWYKTGAVVLKEVVASKRFNSLIQLYKKDYKDALLEYETEYKRHMEHVLNNMRIPKDICFGCAPHAKTIVNLP